MEKLNPANFKGEKQAKWNRQLLLLNGFTTTPYTRLLEKLGENCAGFTINPKQEPLISGMYTYFGQFIDHDVSQFSDFRDNSPPHQGRYVTNENRVLNPLMLTSVYGVSDERPLGTDQKGRFKLNTNGNESAWDIPRSDNGEPNIPDKRNDSNFLLAQMHCLFLRFHNKLINEESLNFEEAKQKVIFTFREIVKHDFLKELLYSPIHDEFFASSGLQRFPAIILEKTNSSIPAAFHAAVFRFGHTMVRNSYEISDPVTFPSKNATSLSRHKMFQYTYKGGYFTPETKFLPIFLRLNWSSFFKEKANQARVISPNVDIKIPHVSNDVNLVTRNLCRSIDYALADAQTYRECYTKAYPDIVTPYFLDINLKVDSMDFDSKYLKTLDMETLKYKTPLWFYCTREALLLYVKRQNNLTNSKGVLGPLASLIAGQVFSKLLKEVVQDNYPSCSIKTLIQLSNYVEGRS